MNDALADGFTYNEHYQSFPVALSRPGKKPDATPLVITITLLAIVIGVFSISLGFVWDEGFHLLAAQLIGKGKVPYIDFCFPQTPLNAYWNAAWLYWTHNSWRATHLVATAEIVGTLILAAQFVFSRMTGLRWQTAAALITTCAIGFNSTLWKFGICAQAYALGTLLSVAAFRATLFAAESAALWPMFCAGALAGGAAASTLLTAPLIPAVLVWLLLYDRHGSRSARAFTFAAGCAVPFIPVFLLFLRAPQQTFFNVVQYQAIFRRTDWPGATAHDFDVLTSWVEDAPSFLVGALALAGFFALRRFPGWTRERCAEFYLCGWIAAGLTLYIAITHPTFQRYFIFSIPFFAMLAAVGAIAFFSKLGFASRPRWPALIFNALLFLALSKSLFDDRDAATWANYHKMVDKIRQVTPNGGLIYADEQVYFLMNLTPPAGMEFSYAHKLELPAAQEKLYHIISDKELTAQVWGGRFATVETCKDDRIDKMKLTELFPKQDEIGDCSVFSGKMRPPLQEKK